MTSPLKIAFVGIDNPHGAGWRDLLAHIESEARLSAVVPHFDGSIASLEEKYSDLPRYNTVGELIAHEQFDAAIVAVSNRHSADVIEELAAAGKHIRRRCNRRRARLHRARLCASCWRAPVAPASAHPSSVRHREPTCHRGPPK